jgi:hypothetical protein
MVDAKNPNNRSDALAAAYRAGAEAMREACATVADHQGWGFNNRAKFRFSDYEEGTYDKADDIAAAIRKLPIPNPKDAAP